MVTTDELDSPAGAQEAQEDQQVETWPTAQHIPGDTYGTSPTRQLAGTEQFGGR